MDIQDLDSDKREMLYHALLILTKPRVCSRKLTIASKRGDQKLLEYLNQYHTFENTFNSVIGEIDKTLNPTLNLESIINRIAEYPFKIKTLTIHSSEYPAELRQINDCSPVLYCVGDTSLFNTKTIAVVGTRDLKNEKDISAEKEIIRRLFNQDYTIVSGLARGCDSLAHSEIIRLGGRTIAVLGNPLDLIPGSERQGLYHRIAKEHLLVSQYPIGIKTFRSYFSYRNLTTVALSKEGVVVVLAGDKSGTLHAVRHCTNQNKPLYVLPINYKRGFKWVEEYRKEYPKFKWTGRK